jgi:hypothetical protein
VDKKGATAPNPTRLTEKVKKEIRKCIVSKKGKGRLCRFFVMAKILRDGKKRLGLRSLVFKRVDRLL